MLAARLNRGNDDDGKSAGDTPDDAVEAWAAPTVAPEGSAYPPEINAYVPLPGSKSLTGRELVLSALADGTGTLRVPLHSRDTDLMVEALRLLGTTIEPLAGKNPYGPDLRVTPAAELTGSTSVDCGLAGTVMRFVPPVAALALGPVAFDGDPYARKRPMRPVLDALRALGADISDDGRGALPFTVHGAGSLRGGRVETRRLALEPVRFSAAAVSPQIHGGCARRPHRRETSERAAHRNDPRSAPRPRRRR